MQVRIEKIISFYFFMGIFDGKGKVYKFLLFWQGQI